MNEHRGYPEFLGSIQPGGPRWSDWRYFTAPKPVGRVARSGDPKHWNETRRVRFRRRNRRRRGPQREYDHAVRGKASGIDRAT